MKFTMNVVTTGCQKMVSQNSSIEFYEAVFDGVKDYHDVALKGIEINGRKIAPPRKVKLDKNNITTMQDAILKSYVESNSSPNAALRGEYGHYYSIMHDGIQKFSHELNGVFLRTISLSDDGIKIVNVPFSLTEIPGGSLTHQKLIVHLFQIIGLIRPPSPENAEDTFIKTLRTSMDEELQIPIPPVYFKCCVIENIDMQGKKITLVMMFWPVGINADGCSVNNLASVKLVNVYGLVTPSARCGSHAADGSIKRMAKSQTYCVEEVKVLAEFFAKILRHFQLSGKSTCLLNNALSALDMKPIHMMTWCPTRMSNLLTCASQVAKGNLLPLCDVMASCNVKPDERDYLMSPNGMILLHLLADLETAFVPKFLRKLDGDKALVIEMFCTSQKLLNSLDDFKSPLADRFLNGLAMDEYGNVVYYVDTANGKQNITLNTSARPRRRGIRNLVEEIKVQAAELREKMTDNLRTNVQDQMQEDSIVEYSSCFDLSLTCSLEDRLENLEKLHNIYCKEYVHEVEEESEFHEEWTVTIRYPAKISCSKEELVGEFKKLWPIFNRTWPKFKNNGPQSLYTFYQHIFDNYSINFPFVTELILILMAVACNTGPLERSYSKLAKLCYKDRNRMDTKGNQKDGPTASTMEILYLLAVHDIKSADKTALYKSASNILRKEK